MTIGTFKDAWAEKERAGYRYGSEALEQVHFGWEIAQAKHAEAIFEMSRELDQLRAQCRALTIARDDAVRTELAAREYRAGLVEVVRVADVAQPNILRKDAQQAISKGDCARKGIAFKEKDEIET